MGLIACSYLPETPDIFTDQKEAYKKAHELRPLELPPELSTEDVTSGPSTIGTATSVVTTTSKKAIVKTTPLAKESKTSAEIVNVGSVSYLLVHDSFRNTWRKTVTALEQLEYDIEDKNREESLIYLNINEATSDTGMLSSLAFWKSDSTSVYLISFDQYSDGIAVEVQDKDAQVVNDDVSKKIYADLLSKLTQ
ncbi:MAG: hypothetical protein COB62_07705 [Piscirickettsiaceae bacterium]|nr:MAG: hypothetical protein COB62_07705 [Piscirickettsiaceae bacterium]